MSTYNVFVGDQYYNRKHLDFILYEVLHAQNLTDYEYFSVYEKEQWDMFLDATDTLTKNYFFPLLVPMDREQPELIEGKIRVHPRMKEIMRICGEGGWISAIAKKESGGMQMPMTIANAASFIMGAANYDITAYPGLTMGAAHLIENYGSKELQEAFLPKMFGGEWQGTMALTEPGAGSSLSDIVTVARELGGGKYKICGQKIFISCGDSDAVENVVHLLLARIAGAPAGTRGISLFVVPQQRIMGDGTLQGNDVLTAGIFHKMGYKGAPIAHLVFGENEDCIGYLVGEPHKGLTYMFQMMNEARISVGLHATSIASAAYYASLKYAKERLQGRPVAEKDPAKPQIPIINHADVRRLLLAQKTFVEGALCLELLCSYYDDMKKVTTSEEYEKYMLLLEILTPVAKSYPAETSCLSTSWALQCFGGYGFTKDYIAELYYRQTRIHTLHEGTTAIHGMDLLGRKVMLQGGKATMVLLQEVTKDITLANGHEDLKEYAKILNHNLERLQHLTMHLMGVAQKEGPEAFLSDATLFLELFGILVMGWLWLKMAVAAKQNPQNEHGQSILLCTQYYFAYEMPKSTGLFTRLMDTNRITLADIEALL